MREQRSQRFLFPIFRTTPDIKLYVATHNTHHASHIPPEILECSRTTQSGSPDGAGQRRQSSGLRSVGNFSQWPVTRHSGKCSVSGRPTATPSLQAGKTCCCLEENFTINWHLGEKRVSQTQSQICCLLETKHSSLEALCLLRSVGIFVISIRHIGLKYMR